MGGKSKSTKVGNHYRIAYHAGLAGRPIDAFLEFRAADKTAWAGRLTASGRIQINAPDLFGGEKDQGGIVGPIDLMFGEPEQLPNPYLQEVFGEQTVAWRGMTTLAFAGGRYGAMNPFAQKPAYKVEKILRGWDGDEPWFPETAVIPLSSVTFQHPTSLYIALDTSGSMSGTKMQVLKEGMNVVLDALAGWITAGAPQINLRIVQWASGSSFEEAVPLTLESVPGLRAFVDGLPASGGTEATAWAAGVQEFNEQSGLGNKVVVIISDGAMTGVSAAQQMIEDAVAAVGFIAMRGIGIQTAGSLGSFDNSGGSVPVISGENVEEMAAAILAALSSSQTSGAMNPAHMLYYCRTDSEKGREPRANINQASLAAAAARLWGEGFGLCAQYNPEQDSPVSFEERICRIIGGSFERSLVDGQWYLDLARGDYDPATLPVMDDDDILEFKELPTTLEGATNSIAVRYFDPQRKETVITPAVRALGLIRQFGEIHETLDFPEIPNGDLATRRADMEVRSRTTPTRAFELVTTPRLGHLRRNQYFMLRSAKRGITGLVCIVGEKDIGTLRSGAVRWKVAQDTYSLPDGSYAEVEEGVDTRPPQDPLPVEHARIYEAPYIDVAAMLPHAELQALPEESGYLLGVAAQPEHGLDYTMAVAPEGGEYAHVATADWCPTATLADALPWGEAPAVVVLADAQGLSQVAVGSPALIGSEVLRVDAVNASAGTATLARGCADTLPQAHADGARIWFVGEAVAADTTEYTWGEVVSARMLTNTGSQQLHLGAAPELTLEFAGRAARPYPPALLRIGADAAPAEVTGEFEVTWAHRDRIGQADQLVDAGMPSIGPEETGRYGMRLLDADDEVLIERVDIAGATATVDLAYTGTATLELWAINDSGDSQQRHVRTFEYTAGAASHHTIEAPVYEPPYTIIDGGEVT
ncbi:MAG: VWA domain-containing protein [Gammaproteobacteria bacterium]|nr:VWA domain-containing protein [Gammaproteobacteria bacterium]